ncbi:Class II aaRS ABD-like protein [Venustampulla echinocandica]|uniref:Class II aaRS ABD-like protein n=1 Tax=Venustampulla echinocandica TaxID=2656787 RepID=A0A370TJ28_9HELO|nr:Class II aaRS ABD-like protein [Venustampulla echinocandica]RDL35367.1 Class II aaRS ABD-like protein [Venustampulla echinocandica]
MGSKRIKPVSSKAALPFKTANKFKRQDLHVKQKKARDSLRRDERFKRKREEDKDPELRRARLAKNEPHSIDKKRVWDEVDGDGLNVSVDVEQLKRRRIEEAEAAEQEPLEDGEESQEEDLDSMLDSDSENGTDEEVDGDIEHSKSSRQRQRAASNAPSLAPSTTSTNLDLTPSSLALKFPTLFSDEPLPVPKVLLTTSINSTLHHEAGLLCTLFPHSTYIPRSAHRYGHKYSLREISKFAANRNYTCVVLLKEDAKKPVGLTIVHLPSGPTCHFSIANWVEGKKLPGHGNPTNHYPELILNNFRTPLGLLTARLFLTLFPPQPELQGRQVVTLHNQRDYIFVRRHRYVFRDKRETEKSVVGTDGKAMEGVEGIRAGLQELGPRFTLKLRRVDKGIGRAGSEGDDAVQWQWKAHMEKQRTRFNL